MPKAEMEGHYLGINFNYNLTYTNSTIEGIIFAVATVFISLSLSKARRMGQKAHLRWLMPMAVYIIEEAVTYAIVNTYDLLNVSEPGLISTIISAADDFGLLAFLWALIVVWRIIQKTPELLQTPWLNRTETPEGVWPPAPKA